MTPFSGRAQLGSLSVSNDGWSWLQQFMSQCGNCGINFIAVHWYNDHTPFNDFQNWVNSACSFGLQVWITEVRMNPTRSSATLLTTISLRHTILSMNRVRFFHKLFHGWIVTLASTGTPTLGLRIMIRSCLRMEAFHYLRLAYNTHSQRIRCGAPPEH